MNVPRSGFLMVAARARRLPSFPGNTQERPLGSEVVEGEAGREEGDDDAAGARGAVAVRGEEGLKKRARRSVLRISRNRLKMPKTSTSLACSRNISFTTSLELNIMQ